MKKIETVSELRALLGEPNEITKKKVATRLSSQSVAFIQRAPMLFLATQDEAGAVTISPKGDGAGFVHVADTSTLYLPERKGNRLIFSLQNILATQQVGLIFVAPNTSETLRISGSCEIVVDNALNQQLADRRGNPALLALKITVTESYFHCAKAFLRSGLWQPESWGEKCTISFAREIAENSEQTPSALAEFDAYVNESYGNAIEEEGMIGKLE